MGHLPKISIKDIEKFRRKSKKEPIVVLSWLVLSCLIFVTVTMIFPRESFKNTDLFTILILHFPLIVNDPKKLIGSSGLLSRIYYVFKFSLSAFRDDPFKNIKRNKLTADSKDKLSFIISIRDYAHW